MSSLHWVIDAAGASHTGQRSLNEDSWRMDPDTGFYIVADGVGGREAGEVASRIACDVTAEQVRSGEALVPAMLAANSAIHAAINAVDDKGSSMASTAVALHCETREGRFSAAWAGDSRLYLWDGKLKTLTRDHSLVESLLQRGEISREEADQHPRKNVILLALGDAQTEVQPAMNEGVLPGDGVFLLCSDGLSDIVDARELCEILSREASLQARADALIQAAVDGGGRDNITALLVSCRQTGGEHAGWDEHGTTGPLVYETFDPVSGERSRYEDTNTRSPTIRRVPPRAEDTGARPEGAALTARAPLAQSTRHGARGRWLWMSAATGLIAGALLLLEYWIR